MRDYGNRNVQTYVAPYQSVTSPKEGIPSIWDKDADPL